MKSLLDVQQDLRNLETRMKDITLCIKTVGLEIDELRNSAENAQNREFDYPRIAILAGRLPFGTHPLYYRSKDGKACQMYLEMLLNIVRMDHEAETTINRLIFIQWLQIQSRIDWTLEELFIDACEMQSDAYTEFTGAISEEYAKVFMLDAFIVANMGGTPNREILEYLSELSSILGIAIEQIQILSEVAYAVLCRKFRRMKREEAEKILNCAQNYKYYIPSDVFDNAIRMQREIAVQFPDTGRVEFKWKVKQMQEIKKGDCIAETHEDVYGGVYLRKEQKVRELRSPSSGVIFQFKDNRINYGVLSIKTDNKDAIKAWIKAGGR